MTIPVHFSPVGNSEMFFDTNGKPLAGGKIYTYYASSFSSMAATYSTIAAGEPNTNPMVLDASGIPPQAFWLVDNVAYNFVLKDSLDTIIWSKNNIIGTTGASTGSTPPGMPAGSLQYNAMGSFAGDSRLIFNPENGQLYATNNISVNGVDVGIGGNVTVPSTGLYN